MKNGNNKGRFARRVVPAFLALALILLTTPGWTSGRRESASGAAGPPTRLVLATTTSTENSELLEELLPPFEARHNVIVDVIALGTGQALQLGRSGDADVLMVHAPSLEEEFVAQGYGIERVYFMYNDFVVLGPSADPAGVRQARSAVEAMERIARAESVFISRGDNSGTHVKELDLWRAAGVVPTEDGQPRGRAQWYREVGQGMGAVITLANDQQAYTLADRGTYLSYVGAIDLAVVFQGDPILFNPYGIIAVDPARHPHVKVDLARALIDHVTSPEGQALITGYLVNGQQLFFPDTD